MKKGFSLLEVIISITLFSIIFVLLYESIAMFESATKSASKQLIKEEQKAFVKTVLFGDLLGADKNTTKIIATKEGEILSMISSNTFHDPFKTNILYIKTKTKKLLRLECAKAFTIDVKFNANSYFKECIADVMQEHLAVFEVQRKDDTIAIFLKTDDGNITSFGVKQLY